MQEQAGVFIDQNDKTGQYRIGITDGKDTGKDKIYYYVDTIEEAEQRAKELHAKGNKILMKIIQRQYN